MSVRLERLEGKVKRYKVLVRPTLAAVSTVLLVDRH